jgi:hypothetical protein
MQSEPCTEPALAETYWQTMMTRCIEQVIRDGARQSWSRAMIDEIAKRVNVNADYLEYRMKHPLNNPRLCKICGEQLEEGESHIRMNDDDTCEPNFDD